MVDQYYKKLGGFIVHELMLLVLIIVIAGSATYFMKEGVAEFSHGEELLRVNQKIESIVYKAHLNVEEIIGGRRARENYLEVIASLGKALEVHSALVEALKEDGSLHDSQLHHGLHHHILAIQALLEKMFKNPEVEAPIESDIEKIDVMFEDLVHKVEDHLLFIESHLNHHKASLENQFFVFLGGTLFLLMAAVVVIMRLRTAVVSQQESLQASRLYHKAIVDAATDAIITCDRRGMIETVNPAVELVFGYKPADLIGQPLEKIMESEMALRHGGFIDHYMNLGVKKIIGIGREVTGVRKDGEVIPVELAVNHMVVKGEHKFVGILRDISQRKEQEAALIRAKDQAEAANQLKSQFLSTISHEIRTPMNGVIGLLELLNDEEMNAEARSYVQTANQSAMELLGLINDILDFSKFEHDVVEVEQIDFNVAELLTGVVRLFQGKGEEKGLMLSASSEIGADNAVRGDPLRIRQVLRNFVHNAIKFTADGEVKVRARVLKETSEKIEIEFSVVDTGIGFDQSNAEKVFMPFVQIDGSITRRFGGTGLGLAICKSLAENMGGSVGVESKPNVGSRFWLRLSLPKSNGAFVVHLPSSKAGLL